MAEGKVGTGGRLKYAEDRALVDPGTKFFPIVRADGGPREESNPAPLPPEAIAARWRRFCCEYREIPLIREGSRFKVLPEEKSIFAADETGEMRRLETFPELLTGPV